MFVVQILGLELFNELSVVNPIKDVNKPSIVFLEDGVFGAQVEWEVYI